MYSLKIKKFGVYRRSCLSPDLGIVRQEAIEAKKLGYETEIGVVA